MITLLEKIIFKNFKCFKNYEINFNQFNIIVGKNNSGKSTIIDAINLISNVIRYSPYRVSINKYDRDSPYSEYDPLFEEGDITIFLLESRDVPFSNINIQHNYSQESSKIIGKFSENREVHIVFPFDGFPYAYFIADGIDIETKRTVKSIFPNSIGLVPQVGLFEDVEEQRTKQYIQSILFTHLMSRHFRNIWYYLNEDFDEFKEMLEATWPSYTIDLPEFDSYANRLDMFFKEDHITREIFWSGHGLQIWLQILTSLVKLGKRDTLVLDEPDVYLHSDLQKRLIHLCKERSNQVIIATHAVDIIEECNPEDIIPIDNKLDKASRLANIDDVQVCINQIGSYQNLKLIHFIKNKTCLFVEGKEFRYIKKFAEVLNKKQIVNEDGFSVVQLDGFSNWEKLKHINWIFHTSLGESIKSFVILDRDYRSDNTIDEMETELQSKNVNVHVWKRKEIENYALNFEVIYRIFVEEYQGRFSSLEPPMSLKNFIKQMARIMDEFKDDVYSQKQKEEINHRINKKQDLSETIKWTYSEFNANWKDVNYRLTVIPGKDFFSRLNLWLNENYSISISPNMVFSNMTYDEIDTEVFEVIEEFGSLLNS